MGEIAEMMLDGAMCEQCGEFIDDGEECGYPRLCAGCQHDVPPVDDGMACTNDGQPRPSKTNCPDCGKLVKTIGLADHQRDVHGASAPYGECHE